MANKKITQLQLEITCLKKINDRLNKQLNNLQTSEHVFNASGALAHSTQQPDKQPKPLKIVNQKFEDMPVNTAMAGIADTLKLMLNSPANKEPDDLITATHDTEESLLSVINDILDFSNIKSGTLDLCKKTFNLRKLLDETLKQATNNAQKKNLQLIAQLPKNIKHEVVGDPARLRQVITYILNNAIKFTEHGEIKLTANVETNNQIIYLNIAIQDTGKGIDPACQTTIFEPFERENNINAIKDFSGTGLGLSISRDLIQLMGGKISLHSTLGVGSTFSFSVALGIGNKTRTTREDNEIRILLAEDTLANQEVMYEQMDLLGYKIEIVENGLQALEAISLNNYTLIFMDIHMPCMDGFAATEAIRAVEKKQHREPVPIIAVTANLSHEVKTRCEKVGMNSYLSKPFSINDIKSILKTWINTDVTQKSQIKSADKTPILSAPKDLNRAVIEQLKTLNDNTDHNTLGNAVHHLNLAYTILFTLQKSRNANALWQHQQLLEAAEHTAQVSHWSWEPDKQQIHFSHHLQRYFDHPISNIKTLNDFIKCIGDSGMDTAIKTCLASNQDSSWEQEIINSNSNESRYLLHRFRIVRSNNNNPMLIGTVQEVSSIRRAEQRIMELAFYDSLTKLSSRSSFSKQLQELIVNSQHRSKQFAILYLDLDDFKNINDSFGHDVGDKFLIEVANRLRHLLRESDFASRLGGDEFCMLINDIKSDHSAKNIAQRCLKLLTQPFILAGREIIPHASIGIAIYPQDGSDANILIKAADTAMNEAKKAGKKQYMLYEAAMTTAAHHRLTIEDDLRVALKAQQFELYYQPKISLSTGKTASVEALIRWNHPQDGLRPPNTFIPDAERLGLITRLGEWVVREACSQIKTWKQQGLDDIAIAVNISPQHFEKTHFARDIAKIVNSSGVSPSLIEIEITESTSRNQHVFLKTCQQLRKSGFRTAIDDFGTGYSSLSVLKDATVDVLKIDREFIRHLPDDSQASILIGTILGMGKALGLKVVAEGVETEAQLKLLVTMGCHMAQGYYFSKPVQAKKIPALARLCFRRPKENQVA